MFWNREPWRGCNHFLWYSKLKNWVKIYFNSNCLQEVCFSYMLLNCISLWQAPIHHCKLVFEYAWSRSLILFLLSLFSESLTKYSMCISGAASSEECILMIALEHIPSKINLIFPSWQTPVRVSSNNYISCQAKNFFFSQRRNRTTAGFLLLSRSPLLRFAFTSCIAASFSREEVE